MPAPRILVRSDSVSFFLVIARCLSPRLLFAGAPNILPSCCPFDSLSTQSITNRQAEVLQLVGPIVGAPRPRQSSHARLRCIAAESIQYLRLGGNFTGRVTYPGVNLSEESRTRCWSWARPAMW
jgi:hypothetical protein